MLFDRSISSVVMQRPLPGYQVHQHWKSAGSYSTVGLELAISVLFGLFVGQWLDKKYSAGGWLTAIGFTFGLIAGGRAVYRALQAANRQAEREAQREAEEEKKYLDGNKR